MLVSLAWLREYVDIDIPPADLAARLTMAGFEVEDHFVAGGDVERLAAARVESVKPHQNSDKLKVCQINMGDRAVEVVCGAPNVKKGIMCVYAPPGTRLPDGRVIGETVIRGVKSCGMLCSLQDLNLEEKSRGIHVIDGDVEPGANVNDLLGLGDDIFEIGVTPNRPDALSVIGVAREVAALLSKPLREPAFNVDEDDKDVNDLARIEIDDSNACPRYVGRVIRGVKVAPSPPWMQRRLIASGMRAINNIVDITNYVLMEMGQPLHAFDYNRLAGRKIIVRRAGEGDKFTTLDDVERAMAETDLMICDGSDPVAVAGVMGGLHSEVGAQTTDVLLESAYFNPGSVRATAKRLGISSEASYRFERGVDTNLQLRACDRAVSLMAELAGGTVAKGAIDVKGDLPQPPEITLRDNRVKMYLGIDIPRSKTMELLKPLGMDMAETDGGLKVKPPSFRPDITEEPDLIEEVARCYGYDNLPATLPNGRVEPAMAAPDDALASAIRCVFSGEGLFEAITMSFMNPQTPEWLGLPDDDRRRNSMVELLNPLSSRESVLRTTILPGLFEALTHNVNRLQENIKLYEIGKVFYERGENSLPDQPVQVAGVYAPSTSKSLYDSGVEPFYEVKGIVEELLEQLKIDARYSVAENTPYLLPGEAALITVAGDSIACLGRVRPEVAEKFNVDVPLYAFEFDFESLLKLQSAELRFKPLDVFPPAFRDLAIVVDDTVEAMQVEDAIKGVDEKVARVRLFDVYKGKQAPAGKKSLAYSITYRWKDRSPLDEDVRKLHGKVVEILKRQFNAQLR